MIFFLLDCDFPISSINCFLGSNKHVNKIKEKKAKFCAPCLMNQVMGLLLNELNHSYMENQFKTKLKEKTRQSRVRFFKEFQLQCSSMVYAKLLSSWKETVTEKQRRNCFSSEEYPVSYEKQNGS